MCVYVVVCTEYDGQYAVIHKTRLKCLSSIDHFMEQLCFMHVSHSSIRQYIYLFIYSFVFTQLQRLSRLSVTLHSKIGIGYHGGQVWMDACVFTSQ